MAIVISNSKKYKEKIENIPRDSEGNPVSDSDKKLRKFYKFNTNVTQHIRLLGDPIEIRQHFFQDVGGVNVRNGKALPILCLRTIGDTCPICEFLENSAFNSEDSEKAARRCNALPSYVFNFITLGKDQINEINVFAFSNFQFKKLSQLCVYWNDEKVWDLENGIPIRVKTKARSNGFGLDYDFQLKGFTEDPENGNPIYPKFEAGKYQVDLDDFNEFQGWVGVIKDSDSKSYKYDNEKDVVKFFFYHFDVAKYNKVVNELKNALLSLPPASSFDEEKPSKKQISDEDIDSSVKNRAKKKSFYIEDDIE